MSRDILFYDIPSRYSESKVVAVIKQLGKINKIQIKKHHKYQSVKAAITLESDYEKLFVDENVWKVKILSDKVKQKYTLHIFKDKDQLNVAMAFDETKIELHGKGNISSMTEISVRRTNSALVSLRLTNNNKGENCSCKDPPIVTPGTHANGSEHLETDEVVEEVSNVMKEWRNFEFTCGKPLKTPEEIKEAKERENKDWEKWLSHFEKKKPTVLEKKEEVADKKEKEVLLMDLKTKDDEREENLVKKEGVSIKPVTPVELHECNTVNASCLTRLSCDNLQIKEEKNSESDEGCVKRVRSEY
ncbi:unnamed protein product [Rhizophagus irregularis]|nr:unnamed protein product [Rhizophagus irregularis]